MKTFFEVRGVRFAVTLSRSVMPLSSVYVHFPWCLRKCPYCDFATSPKERDALAHTAYADAILRELVQREDMIAGQTLYSIFFGGGTPSLWQAEELGRVIEGIVRAFKTHDEAVEITVECNPSSLDKAHARALREVGVNRLSVGVQSLDDRELTFLGRLHDRNGALSALEAALESHDRVSADLMFGLPGQARERFHDHVQALLKLGLKHVSAYALTIEPATRFGELSRKGLLQQAPDEDYALMFEGNERLFRDHGLLHYEVSNYALPGEESRHNLHYWRGGAYLGLGAAAVGCVHEGHGARRYRNHPDAERYMARATSRDVEVFSESLDPSAVIREALMLGLRTSEGIDVAALEQRTGKSLFEGRKAALERRISRGDLELQDGRVRVPHSRWLLLDGIVADLF